MKSLWLLGGCARRSLTRFVWIMYYTDTRQFSLPGLPIKKRKPPVRNAESKAGATRSTPRKQKQRQGQVLIK